MLLQGLVNSPPQIASNPSSGATASLGSLLWGFVGGVIVAAIGGFIAYRLYDWYKSRVTVVFAQKTGSRGTREFAGLYTQLIDEDDRIDPERVTRWLRFRERSPRSVKALRQAAERYPGRSYHIFLLAKSSLGVVGFLKSVFIPSAKVMFIAYVGAEGVPKAGQRAVMSAMASTQQELLRSLDGLCEWVAFEVTHEDKPKRRVEARCKLFRDYVGIMGFRAYRIQMDYLQPDLDPLHSGAARAETKAYLFVVPLRARKDVRKTISHSTAAGIVSSIYRDVYAEAFEDMADVHYEYRRYLQDLEVHVLSGLPNNLELV